MTQCTTHCVFQTISAHFAFDEVGYDFGVSFCFKVVPFVFELVF